MTTFDTGRPAGCAPAGQLTDVRLAHPRERDEVRDVLLRAYREHAPRLPAAIWDSYLPDLLDDGGAGVLVVVLDGRVVGTARLYHPGAAQVPVPAGWAYLRALAVDPETRGRGIARALMAAAAHRAQQAGAGVLGLHTAHFMHGTLRLCDVFGYRRVPAWDVDLRNHYGLPEDSDPLTAIAYALDLADGPAPSSVARRCRAGR